MKIKRYELLDKKYNEEFKQFYLVYYDHQLKGMIGIRCNDEKERKMKIKEMSKEKIVI